MNDFVDLNNARPGTDYEKTIVQIKKDGVCPFCPEQLATYHKNPIFKENGYWKVTDNMYPYTAAGQHILFIHKGHISHHNEIMKDAWDALHALLKEVSEERGITGGSLLMRFGNTRYTGASVTHLHAHLIQSDPGHDKYAEEKRFQGGVWAKVG